MMRLPHRAAEADDRAQHEDTYYRSLVAILKGENISHEALARSRDALGIPVEKFVADLDVIDRSPILRRRRSEGP